MMSLPVGIVARTENGVRRKTAATVPLPALTVGEMELHHI